MPERTEINLENSMKEFGSTNTEYPGVHFEPARHALTAQTGIRLRKNFNRGDFEHAFVWDTMVLARMRDYHPQIITVDSVVPSKKGDHESYQYYWSLLPGKPSDITGSKDGIILVCGDIGGFRSLSDWALEDEVDQANFQFSSRSFVRGLCNALVAGMGTVQGIQALGEKGLSRRRFIKFAGSALFLGLTDCIPNISYKVASLIPDSQISDFFVRLADQLYTGISSDLWTNCRTALLITKEEEAITRLGMPKNTSGAIIMGYSHLAGGLINNRENRQKTIAQFASQLTDQFLEAVERTQKFSYIERRLMVNQLLDYMAAVQVLKLNDAYVSEDGTKKVPITEVEWFLSPAVLQAVEPYKIKGLGD